MQAAIQEVGTFTADMSGNEEIKPMKFAYDMILPKGYSKKIFFLTDGGVGNHKAVVDLVKANADKANLYTLGIQCSG